MGSQPSKTSTLSISLDPSQSRIIDIKNSAQERTVQVIEVQVTPKTNQRPVFVPRPIALARRREYAQAEIQKDEEQKEEEQPEEGESESEKEAEEGDWHTWRSSERIHQPAAHSAVAKKPALKTVLPAILRFLPLGEDLKTDILVAGSGFENAVAVDIEKKVSWDVGVKEEGSVEEVRRNGFFKMAEVKPLVKPITTNSLPRHVRVALAPLLPASSNQPLYTHPLIHVYATTAYTAPLTAEERFEFLTLLSPSYPSQILCTACRTLHSQAKRRYFHRYSPKYPPPLTGRILEGASRDRQMAALACPNELRIGTYHSSNQGSALPILPFLFTPAQVQHAVKCAAIGLGASSRLPNLNWFRVFQRRAWVHVWGVTNKIVDGRLLLRTQHWFMLRERDSENNAREIPAKVVFKALLQSIEHHQMIDGCLMLCKHQRKVPAVKPPLFEKQWRKLDGKWKRKTVRAVEFGCTKCASEFEVEFGVVRRNVLVITGWRDLGRCETLDDPRFRSHFWEFDAERIRARQSERLCWRWEQNAVENLVVKPLGECDSVGRLNFSAERQILENLTTERVEEKGVEKAWIGAGESATFVPGSIKTVFEGDESSLELWANELDRNGWLSHLETTLLDYGERSLLWEI